VPYAAPPGEARTELSVPDRVHADLYRGHAGHEYPRSI